MKEKERILAIDFGEVRIGLAISDPMGITAQPLNTLKRKGKKQDVAYIADIVSQNSASLVIIGLPLKKDGSEGTIFKSVQKFTRSLEVAISPIPVEYADERFTTVQAEALLIEADVSRAKRKEKIDTMAAQLILQGYLARRDNLKE